MTFRRALRARPNAAVALPFGADADEPDVGTAIPGRSDGSSVRAGAGETGGRAGAGMVARRGGTCGTLLPPGIGLRPPRRRWARPTPGVTMLRRMPRHGAGGLRWPVGRMGGARHRTPRPGRKGPWVRVPVAKRLHRRGERPMGAGSAAGRLHRCGGKRLTVWRARWRQGCLHRRGERPVGPASAAGFIHTRGHNPRGSPGAMAMASDGPRDRKVARDAGGRGRAQPGRLRGHEDGTVDGGHRAHGPARAGRALVLERPLRMIRQHPEKRHIFGQGEIRRGFRHAVLRGHGVNRCGARGRGWSATSGEGGVGYESRTRFLAGFIARRHGGARMM